MTSSNCAQQVGSDHTDTQHFKNAYLYSRVCAAFKPDSFGSCNVVSAAFVIRCTEMVAVWHTLRTLSREIASANLAISSLGELLASAASYVSCYIVSVGAARWLIVIILSPLFSYFVLENKFFSNDIYWNFCALSCCHRYIQNKPS